MKAKIGALLIGLSAAGASSAQSPAFDRVLGPSTVPWSPVPPLPTAQVLQNLPARSGAQFAAVPMPAVPSLPKAIVKEIDSYKPFVVADPADGYVDQFNPPETPAFTGDVAPLNRAPVTGPRLWMTADYTMWWLKRASLPTPLVVTGPESDPFAGALDQPGTRVLYGGQSLNFNPYSGLRVHLGIWCGNDNRLGFEMGGFVTDQQTETFHANGSPFGQPYIARPFINARTGQENVYFVSQNFAAPGRSAFMTGAIDVVSNSRLWSWELNGLYNLSRDEFSTTNLIAGFRSVGLRERLHISESLRNLNTSGALLFRNAPVSPNTGVNVIDKFDAENTFYGGQLGARTHFQWGRLGVDLTGKAALGVIQQLVAIDGSTALLVPGAPLPTVERGGVYAVNSNIGRQFKNRFGFIPEGNIDLTYEVTEGIILKAGYTFLYMNSVQRPGEQIDRTVNPGLVPTDIDYRTPGGPARPSVLSRTTDIWAQGLSLGVEVRY